MINAELENIKNGIQLRKIKKKKNCSAQRGARTHDPEIKSLMLYRLS